MTMDLGGWAILAVGLAAVGEDLARRQISNWTTGGAALAGWVWHGTQAGWSGLGDALLGTVIGFGVFLVFYLMGGMGGGDVKLMAGFGALLGSGPIWMAALLAALCGGVLAALVLALRRVRRWWWPAGAPAVWSESIPYAPAITAGVWLAVVGGA
ncbi:MAG: prepilin peptidase [Bryobacterales bacterium]|nr:prepilin peptidase [Bryobacterales bacterium]